MMVVVTGAGGFIGGHLVGRLLAEGHTVRAVDIKPSGEWFQEWNSALNVADCDLRNPQAAHMVTAGAEQVYNLAADMGGMGYLGSHDADAMVSVLISTNMLRAAAQRHARYFYSSSACIYPEHLQLRPDVVALREADAYPAMPDLGYGWEKLFAERMCDAFTRDRGTVTRVALCHNVYGPHGTWMGGREKAPAAICRKVAEAVLLGRDEIEVWGDGEQARSFMFIDDCIEGTRRLMDSNVTEPLNVGSAEMVTINQLIDTVEQIASAKLTRQYNLDAPQGVRGRNSDNTRSRQLLGWEPSIPLTVGLEATYQWVYDQLTGAM